MRFPITPPTRCLGLAEPERAARHGVIPPRAITLFGPPGTGKTTLARAIASRIGWPFVELLPSRLADEGNLAAALRTAFARIGELQRVLVFIDEVEEIAPVRGARPEPGMHGVTNELLKLIPGFRERDERLLVCATNSIRSLDPAFLRPGRFDYLIPIGTPDPAARAAIWSRRSARRDDVDLDALVAAGELFTPADIEHTARIAGPGCLRTRLRRGGRAHRRLPRRAPPVPSDSDPRRHRRVHRRHHHARPSLNPQRPIEALLPGGASFRSRSTVHHDGVDLRPWCRQCGCRSRLLVHES
ncbi:ATP-binding protein [Streptomyces sp. NBC_00842]|uniref:ATP-binding protein n=1 Tax=unclassified Streptomyces TaxID=2593676 RepID=UPI0038670E93